MAKGFVDGSATARTTIMMTMATTVTDRASASALAVVAGIFTAAIIAEFPHRR